MKRLWIASAVIAVATSLAPVRCPGQEFGPSGMTAQGDALHGAGHFLRGMAW
jgi:hypothetical protein